MALRTIVLAPGECATLPESATIISITVDGDGQVNSDCDNLPEVTGYVCYKFYWEDDESGSLQDAVFTSLILGDNTYNVPPTYADYNGTNISLWIAADPQFEGVVKLGCASVAGDHTMKVKVPGGLPAPKLKITNPSGGGDQILYMEGIVDEDCTDCS